jgi:hypothetical protein
MYRRLKYAVALLAVLLISVYADSINFEQQVNNPSVADVIVSKVAQPDEWYVYLVSWNHEFIAQYSRWEMLSVGGRLRIASQVSNVDVRSCTNGWG